MARVLSATQAILACRQRANMENSTFCTDDEILEYYNQELTELWNLIYTNDDKPHFRNFANYTITGSSDSIQPLPIDFLSVQEVVGTWNGFTMNLQPFMASEHGAYLNTQLGVIDARPVYRIQGGNIEFLPANQAFTAQLFYTPCQVRLEDGSDTFDGFNGYEMMPIYGVVATMLAKEESDPSIWLRLKDRLEASIKAWAAKRDAANPERVQETVSYDNGIYGGFRWWGR